VREILASEVLHRLGVTTSRTLSLIETGEDLWRGEEPSPTRSSVMVCLARTHLRFGTCERLLYLRQPDKLERLLRHGVVHYCREMVEGDLLAFSGTWWSRWRGSRPSGWPPASPTACSTPITGRWRGRASTTAASPSWSSGIPASRRLQEPLAGLLPRTELEGRLERFAPAYYSHYRALMLRRRGLIAALPGDPEALAPFMSGAPEPPRDSWLAGLRAE
jgi:hypothetical protein